MATNQKKRAVVSYENMSEELWRRLLSGVFLKTCFPIWESRVDNWEKKTYTRSCFQAKAVKTKNERIKRGVRMEFQIPEKLRHLLLLL